ncbi:hypothetical protein F2P47_06255 [Parvibaculum sedimenti]|uniref:ATP-grasp domain-containing protein n=1 Tax=Parvibaculum sedimenti TaxID=2608632 RepID=A0A6N6VJU9_9HYPH|nr:hypothetical protein [Parvibaculum sedimenti]KAB7741341.1 hypothetical protein F2P47_06255 [Parvibaculum sedimenti]
MPLISIACGTGRLPQASVLQALADIWRERGIVSVWGPAYAPEADACILHIDRTRLEPTDVPPPPRGLRAINGSILDISKRLFSVLEVYPGSDWSGQVIVKTNLNHFGLPELRGNHPAQRALDRLRMRIADISWHIARTLPDRTYPVLPSIRHVPRWVWDNPRYIVEKFMPEKDGDLYCLRGWMFLGPVSYGWRLFSTDPLVKTGTMVRYEFITEVPGELVELRNRTKFDFGKFDYVMHDGKPIVLDLNKTPAYSGDPASPRLHKLAEGIEGFLP